MRPPPSWATWSRSASDRLLIGARSVRLTQRLAGICDDGRDRLAEQPHGLVDLSLVDDEWRRHAHDILACLEHQQTACERCPLDGLGCLARVELHADHQSLAAHVLDRAGMIRGDLTKTGHRLLAAGGRV